MNIDDFTLGDLKKISSLFDKKETTSGLNSMVGEKVIIRTYSAGVWFGTLKEKSGNEVILSDARRMWRWWAKESISLSAVSVYGIKQDKSKIATTVEYQWLEAIEITPCTQASIKSIESAPDAKAE